MEKSSDHFFTAFSRVSSETRFGYNGMVLLSGARLLRSEAVVSQAVAFQLEVPDDLAKFQLPEGVQHRLDSLLDQQDRGDPLSAEERREAEGLVNLADLLSVLRLRAERANHS